MIGDAAPFLNEKHKYCYIKTAQHCRNNKSILLLRHEKKCEIIQIRNYYYQRGKGMNKQNEALFDFLSGTFGSSYGYALYDFTGKIIKPLKTSGIGNASAVKSSNEIMRKLLLKYGTSEECENSVTYSDSESGMRYRVLYLKDGDTLSGAILVLDSLEKKKLLLSELENYLQAELVSRPIAVQNFAKTGEIQSLSELDDLVQYLIVQMGVQTASELNPNDKIKLVKELKRRGVFKYKGVVRAVAPLLSASAPTIYRYLSQLDEMPVESISGAVPKGNIHLI